MEFVNSEFSDHRGGGGSFDRLGLAPWWAWFAGRWQLGPPPPLDAPALARLRELRGLLRTLLTERRRPRPAELRVLNRVLAAAPAVWSLGTAGSRLALEQQSQAPPLERAMAGIVLSYAAMLAGGEIARVKACANPDCTFLFTDTTRNASRRWCDPAMCGNLVKVRAFRARRNSTAAG